MFDKKICLDNIRTLAKEKGIKLGELEEQAGVSAGYISRIEKSESSPAFDFIIKVADILSVSIDFLINNNLSTMTSTNLYIARLIDKLISDTTSNHLFWEREEESYLNDNINFLNTESAFYHPLFSEVKNPNSVKDFEYNSLFHDPRCVSINADCFNCEIIPDIRIYLMSTVYYFNDTQSDEFELYIVNKKNNVNKLICVKKGEKSDHAISIKLLYGLANKSSKQTNIPSEIKTLIDDYIES